jgi:hypothetical protein
MPEFLAPGVFVEEAPGGPRPIERVPVCTAALLGCTARGPLAATRITSKAEFASRYGAGAMDGSFYLPAAVSGFFENGGKDLVVVRLAPESAETARAVLPGEEGGLSIAAAGPGAWSNGIRLHVRHESSGRFALQVTAPSPAVEEEFVGLSGDACDPDFAVERINTRSRLVMVESCAGTPAETVAAGVALEGGSDASPGDSEVERGLEKVDGASLVGLLDAPPSASARLIHHCETRRDRFAVLAAPGPESFEAPADSAYAAAYAPWLRIGLRLVPPVGHVLGVLASAASQYGVHRDASNVALRGVDRLAAARTESPHPRVNLIRDFRTANRGIRVWGARTLSTQPEWKYVKVRRLVLQIEQSIERGTQWVAFEPDAERLWASIRDRIERFLDAYWREGALQGRRPSQAYFVRCDRTTMTQADLDQGRVLCVIGLAPVKPAEFIILRFGWQL